MKEALLALGESIQDSSLLALKALGFLGFYKLGKTVLGEIIWHLVVLNSTVKPFLGIGHEAT